MNIPSDLQYTKEHVWIKYTGDDDALIGVTDYAQSTLGEIVAITLPDAGDALRAGESLGDVESAKVISEVISPVSATVKQINEDLMDNPEEINADPYGSWLIAVTGISGAAGLLDAAAYEALCAEEG